MITPGDITTNINILANLWFQYVFNVEPQEYENFEFLQSGSQVILWADLKPKSRNPKWAEIDIGQTDDLFEDFPGQFKIAFVEFQREHLYFRVDIRTISGKTEYSIDYAPPHIRDKWQKPSYTEPVEQIEKFSAPLGVKVKRASRKTLREFIRMELDGD